MDPRDMVAIVDGEVTTVGNVSVEVVDPGFHRGDGVFEVFQLYGDTPFALDEHLERLDRGARRLMIDYDVDALARECAEIPQLCAPDMAIRVIVTRFGRRIVYEEPNGPFPERFGLLAIEHRVSPLMSGIKSLSYGANILAHRLAQQSGHDTALFVDADTAQVMEAPFMTFVWTVDGQLFTPPISAGILDGITRRALLEAGLCHERECQLADIDACDGAALLGSGFELRLVSNISGLVSRTFTDDPCLVEAAEALHRRILQRTQSNQKGIGNDAGCSVSADHIAR